MAIHIVHYKIEKKNRDGEIERREYFRVEKPSAVPFYPHTVITDQVVEDARKFGFSMYDHVWQCFLALDRKSEKEALDDGIGIITKWMIDHSLEAPRLSRSK